MRQKEGSVHRGRGNREQGGIQSLAAVGQEGISANARRQELETSKGGHKHGIAGLQMAVTVNFCTVFLGEGEVPGKVSGDEMGYRTMQTRGHGHSQPQ